MKPHSHPMANRSSSIPLPVLPQVTPLPTAMLQSLHSTPKAVTRDFRVFMLTIISFPLHQEVSLTQLSGSPQGSMEQQPPECDLVGPHTPIPPPTLLDLAEKGRQRME